MDLSKFQCLFSVIGLKLTEPKCNIIISKILFIITFSIISSGFVITSFIEDIYWFYLIYFVKTLISLNMLVHFNSRNQQFLEILQIMNRSKISSKFSLKTVETITIILIIMIWTFYLSLNIFLIIFDVNNSHPAFYVLNTMWLQVRAYLTLSLTGFICIVYHVFKIYNKQHYDRFLMVIEEGNEETGLVLIVRSIRIQNYHLQNLKTKINNSFGFILFLFFANCFEMSFFSIIFYQLFVIKLFWTAKIEFYAEYIIDILTVLIIFWIAQQSMDEEEELKSKLILTLMSLKVTGNNIESKINRLIDEINQNQATYVMIWKLCKLDCSVLLNFIYISVTFTVMVITIYRDR